MITSTTSTQQPSRRSFLKALVGGVAVAAAARTFPFRVYSFPTAPVIAPASPFMTIAEISRESLRILVNNLAIARNYDQEFLSAFKVGDVVNIRRPTYIRPAGLKNINLRDFPSSS